MDPLRLILWSLTAAGAFGLTFWMAAPGSAAQSALVTVNGTRLAEADLALRLRPDHARDQPKPEQQEEYRREVLETMIGEELAAQRAHELGLDGNPEYLAGLAPLQAQVDAYKRRMLSELFVQHELSRQGVTEAEARAFFDQNERRLKTKVQVLQILRRSADSIEQARVGLAAAPSFDAYMRSQAPDLPEGERPWDLGYLRWEQLPEAWRDVVYSMKKGEISPVIHAQKDRYWILQLADVRELPEVTFESVRPTLLEALKARKLAQVRQHTTQDLRSRASVVYAKH